MKLRNLGLALGGLALAYTAAVVQAGSSLLCFPLEIGDAPSLPWRNDGWKGQRADYDVARLAEDTVALLGRDVPALVRMETLRRATLYAITDANAARQLMERLQARADKEGGLAVFDLGYLDECYRRAEGSERQARVMPRAKVVGFELIKQALKQNPDPEIAYAAALVRHGDPGTEGFFAQAVEGATKGSRLARTLESHRPLWGSRLKPQQAAQR